MWLLLNENISKKFNIDEPYTYLIPLEKINIIVGKNNSGKSYLMRQIIKSTIKVLNRDDIKEIAFDDTNFFDEKKFRNFKYVDGFEENNDRNFKILEQISNFSSAKYDSGSRRIGGGHSVVYNFTNFHSLVDNSKELIDFLEINNRDKYDNDIYEDFIAYNETNLRKQVVEKYKEEILKKFETLNDGSLWQFGLFFEAIGYIKLENSKYDENYNNPAKEGLTEIFKNYIPILRNIRDPLKKPKSKQLEPNINIFKSRIIEEYNYNDNEVNVITGLDFYFDYKRKLLGNKKDRGMVNNFELFLSEYFFEGKNISIIPDEETYELKINIEDREDKFIYQVGDGITSLIIIMYHVFMHCDRDINIYFIEEPEQNFHPGFQRLFMNIISLNEKFKNCYFFFTTHSNHIIDISNHEFKNFRNYLCTKEKDKILVKVQDEKDISVIEELGVKPSSVQIANKIIWVEGKYDAFYIRLLLNKKAQIKQDRKYIEEYDYTFVPYGGSNGTLINFSINNSINDNEEFIMKAKSINHNMLLIMDDDGISTGKKNAKSQRYQELKSKLNDKLYKLEVREIENLFPPSVIKKYFIQGIKKADSYDTSFLNNIVYNDYKNKKLGDYLNSLVKKNLGNNLKEITGREDGFEKKGFLYDKSKFYDCVLEWIMSDTFDYKCDVPDEAKHLINIVEKFIES